MVIAVELPPDLRGSTPPAAREALRTAALVFERTRRPDPGEGWRIDVSAWTIEANDLGIPVVRGLAFDPPELVEMPPSARAPRR